LISEPVLPSLNETISFKTPVDEKRSNIPAWEMKRPPGTWWDEKDELLKAGDKTPRFTRDLAPGGVDYRVVTYSGAGMALEMPSVESCRRYAKTLGDPATFDLPIKARHRSGESASGWVRVSRVRNPPPPRWGARTLDGGKLPVGMSARISESVDAMLESKHRLRGLSEYRDILDHQRDRLYEEGVPLIQTPRSDAVAALGYRDGVLYVVHPERVLKRTGEYVPAKLYAYSGVPHKEFDRLLNSGSIGANLQSVKKWTVPVDKSEIEVCPHCQRPLTPGIPHRCAVSV
jgi:hypothetical protein